MALNSIDPLPGNQRSGAGVMAADEAGLTGLKRSRFSDTIFKVATQTWFVVAVIGQWAFLAYLLAFYVPTTLTGNIQLWTKNTLLQKGYVPGDSAGNLAFGAHALLAAIIAFGGALQLIPRLRRYAPGFHRWNGRVFMVTALCLSCTGLYMIWLRGTLEISLNHIAITLNGVLLIVLGALAWRSALRRDIAGHRRWALRTYLVANAQWFTRVGLFAWIIINQGPVGMGANFDGPVVIIWSFGCYLLPLAILELYFRCKDSPIAWRKFALASTLFMATLLTAVGTVGVSMFAWIPAVKAVNDDRISIADTLSATITASGIEQAIQQYHDLKAAAPARYNFDQSELRRLGKQLGEAKRFDDAIRILRLNVEAFPTAARAHARLAEAYLAAGNSAEAINTSQVSLKLDPSDEVALHTLQEARAR